MKPQVADPWHKHGKPYEQATEKEPFVCEEGKRLSTNGKHFLIRPAIGWFAELFPFALARCTLAIQGFHKISFSLCVETANIGDRSLQRVDT